MKKLTYAFIAFVTVLITLSAAIQAQALVQDFGSYSIGDSLDHIGWSTADIQAKIADDPVTSGNKVLQNTIHNYNAAPVLMFVLQSGKTLADYSSFTFKSYWAQGDVGYKDIVVEAYQTMPTAQFANNASAKIGSWNRAKMGSTAWEDITVDITNTSSLKDTIYIAFGINCAGTGNVGGTGVTTIWYADDVSLVPKPIDTTLVSQWGLTSQGKVWPILNTAGTPAGNASIGGPNPIPGWATVRGEFDTLQATLDIAVVVTGKIEFVGTSGGGSTYTPLRYALTYHANDTLNYPLTDSASWVRALGSGYAFQPRTGAGTVSNGAWGSGTMGVINNGNWNSSNSNGGPALATILQAPRNAEMITGTYDFAFSVRQVNDTTNEIRWYLVEETNKYWFGGTVTGPAPTTKFNGICFGVNTGGWTQVNLTEVKAELGDPIVVPEAPWEDFYVDANQWGVVGGKTGGWTFIPGAFDGNAGIGGAGPNAGLAAIRGSLGGIPVPTAKILKFTGKIILEGGGFEGASGLRFGISNGNAGSIQNGGTDSARWDGSEANHSGYLFIPRSGTNALPTWAGTANTGTWGAVKSSVWYGPDSSASNYVLGSEVQLPANAASGAGTYNFIIEVQTQASGINVIGYSLTKSGGGYSIRGFGDDTHSPVATTNLNNISFALNSWVGSTTTALKVEDVQVTQSTTFEIPVELTSFVASVIGSEVTLNWSTATESNNYGFEVQRKTLGGNFETVTFVKGNGTTTQKNDYSFIDKNLVEGKYSYRLKQVDLDGQFDYSNTIEVDVSPVYKFTLEQNYPNPFNPVTTISYVLQEKTIAKITLINVVGEEVAVLVNEEQDKGFHKIQVNGSNLASGVYFYKLVAKDFVNTKKMILMK